MVDYKVFGNVQIGEDVEISDFAIIGLPLPGMADGQLETIIGSKSSIVAHSVIHAGVRLGDGFVCGHGVVIGQNTIVGDNCSVGVNSVIQQLSCNCAYCICNKRINLQSARTNCRTEINL